jgi:hypothetical protein
MSLSDKRKSLNSYRPHVCSLPFGKGLEMGFEGVGDWAFLFDRKRKCDHFRIDFIYYVGIPEIWVPVVQINEPAAEFYFGR